MNMDVAKKDVRIFSIQKYFPNNPIIFTFLDEATPLWTAACFGHLTTVKLLVEHGSLIDKGTAIKSTPVRAACYEGHLEIGKQVITRVLPHSNPLQIGVPRARKKMGSRAKRTRSGAQENSRGFWVSRTVFARKNYFVGTKINFFSSRG